MIFRALYNSALKVGQNVKKTYYATGPKISSPKRILEARAAKTDVIFEVSVEFYSETMKKISRLRELSSSHSAVWTWWGLAQVFFTFALLSERCNFVKMIAMKLFIGIIFVENFTQYIFCNLTFFSKVHISRGNRGKLTLRSRFDPVQEERQSRRPWVSLGDI